MDDDPTAWRRRVLNRLAAIKLALQMLDRKTELSASQRHLVGTALEAADGLLGELREQWRAEPAAPRPPGSLEARGRSAAGRPGRGRGVGPAVAGAALMGALLLVLIVVGAALLLQVLGVVLLVAAVAWLSRR